jgi:hypothetical protein
MMSFSCTLPHDIKDHETIILPISMNQPLERGDRLAAILKAFEKYGYKKQVTILICDYLNRHNCKYEEEALEQGEKFISDHHELLKDYSLLTWKSFLDSRNQNQFNSFFSLISKNCIDGTRFYNKMKKTWEKCLSTSQTLEASIKYQIEEYASILCMGEFDHLFYPKRITNGMAYLYNFIEGKKPIYHHIKITEDKSKLIKDTHSPEAFYLGSLKKNRNQIHIAFRAVLEHMETLLESQELSLKAKKVFAEEAENLLLTHGLFDRFELTTESVDTVID